LNIPSLLDEEDLRPKRKGTKLPKRSMNAFFIYRKALDKELQNRGYYDLRMRVKVRYAGILWKNESREVKDICQQLANKAKKLLEQELNSTTNYCMPTSQPVVSDDESPSNSVYYSLESFTPNEYLYSALNNEILPYPYSENPASYPPEFFMQFF
ncbi:6922_t:CDS:1, partial [Ambispora leptoticha]